MQPQTVDLTNNCVRVSDLQVLMDPVGSVLS